MKAKYLYYVGLIAACGIGFLYAYMKKKQLDTDYGITQGRVVNLSTSPNSAAAFIKYDFQVGKALYSGSSSLPIRTVDEYKFLNRILQNLRLPVIYQLHDPHNNQMILYVKDSEK